MTEKVALDHGRGLVLCGTLATDKKKQDIQCTQGFDVAFAICLVAATQMANDELHQAFQENTAGGDDDWQETRMR